jgi:hypothetical protein
VGTSSLISNWGSLTPLLDIVGFLALLSVSSVGFPFHLLCSQNSLMDRGEVWSSLFPLWQRSLWGLLSSHVPPLCTLHTGHYSCFPFRSWWRFLLVPCFGRLESISDFRRLAQWYILLGGQWWWVSRIHVTWQNRRQDVVQCFLILTSGIQSGLTRASEIQR